MAQRLEQRCNDEGRDYNSDSVTLVEHPLKQGLQGKNEAKVQQGEQNSQCPIDQRAGLIRTSISYRAIAQDREADRERDEQDNKVRANGKEHLQPAQLLERQEV